MLWCFKHDVKQDCKTRMVTTGRQEEINLRLYMDKNPQKDLIQA